MSFSDLFSCLGSRNCSVAAPEAHKRGFDPSEEEEKTGQAFAQAPPSYPLHRGNSPNAIKWDQSPSPRLAEVQKKTGQAFDYSAQSRVEPAARRWQPPFSPPHSPSLKQHEESSPSKPASLDVEEYEGSTLTLKNPEALEVSRRAGLELVDSLTIEGVVSKNFLDALPELFKNLQTLTLKNIKSFPPSGEQNFILKIEELIITGEAVDSTTAKLEEKFPRLKRIKLLEAHPRSLDQKPKSLDQKKEMTFSSHGLLNVLHTQHPLLEEIVLSGVKVFPGWDDARAAIDKENNIKVHDPKTGSIKDLPKSPCKKIRFISMPITNNGVEILKHNLPYLREVAFQDCPLITARSVSALAKKLSDVSFIYCQNIDFTSVLLEVKKRKDTPFPLRCKEYAMLQPIQFRELEEALKEQITVRKEVSDLIEQIAEDEWEQITSAIAGYSKEKEGNKGRGTILQVTLNLLHSLQLLSEAYVISTRTLDKERLDTVAKANSLFMENDHSSLSRTKALDFRGTLIGSLPNFLRRAYLPNLEKVFIDYPIEGLESLMSSSENKAKFIVARKDYETYREQWKITGTIPCIEKDFITFEKK